MLCPSKVSDIRSKLQPSKFYGICGFEIVFNIFGLFILDYKFSIINKTNKSETYFIVHLADDLEKKTEIALQNYFSPLFHEEIQETNVTNPPQVMGSNIFNEEAKQLQHAINESLKDCKLLEESDVSPPKRCKLSPGEKDINLDHESVELTTGHTLNGAIYNSDAIEQDSRVYILRESSAEQKMETEDVNINNNNEG